MNINNVVDGIKENLNAYGYVELPGCRARIDTEAFAKSIGSIFDVSSVYGYKNVSIVQSLRPRAKSVDLRNQYSGNYGYDDFPMHTDLAHWLRPPRYLMLRCIVGTSSVATRLLSNKYIKECLGEYVIKRAIVKTRKKGRFRGFFLPLEFNEGSVTAFRWDSMFLVPMNGSSWKVRELLLSEQIKSFCRETILRKEGDTIIIDNWKMLHGRSAVVPGVANRRLVERIYLDNIGK